MEVSVWRILGLCGVNMGGAVFALVAFVGAFFVAQLWKFITGAWNDRGRTVKRTLGTWIGYFMRSGGMPSGHAASFTALMVYLGCWQGFDSGVFILAVGTWVIILYDAMHVRYAVGEQGKALNRLLKKNGEAELPIVEGHTPLQVAVGVVLGVVIGVSVAMWGQGMRSEAGWRPDNRGDNAVYSARNGEN